MNAVFADTFYWAALTSTDDADHGRAMDLSRSIVPDRIVTTDEVLGEYLAFFASARPSVRAQAGNRRGGYDPRPPLFWLFHKHVNPFSRVWNCTGRARTRATAWLIAFPCRRCARRDSQRFSPTTGISSRKAFALSSATPGSFPPAMQPQSRLCILPRTTAQVPSSFVRTSTLRTEPKECATILPKK